MKRITASVITIGDELLIGQVIDTNSAWMAVELIKIGIWLRRTVSVGDVKNDILNVLDEEGKNSDIILITGGLGPTADDITKPVLCEYFGGKLVTDEATLQHIEHLFKQVFHRSGPLLERNRKQAEVPDVCTVLKNETGTAPGMWFEKNDKIYVSLPGVPHEMKGIMTNRVLPQLLRRFKVPKIGHRTLLTIGIGESNLAELIQPVETNLPENIKLAYLPNNTMVRLRLTGFGEEETVEKDLDAYFSDLQQLTAPYLVATEDITIADCVGKLLKENGYTVSTAESCTGGYIAHLLTKKAGSSAYFSGSVVSYANSIKENVLHVASETLLQEGAVSEETVIQMAENCRKLMGTDFSIAVSGIMGPDGGSAEKPVGTVWIAVCGKKGLETKKLNLRYDRERNIEITAVNALNLLRLFILKQ